MIFAMAAIVHVHMETAVAALLINTIGWIGELAIITVHEIRR